MSRDLDFRERAWGTADGRRVLLKDMDIGHLVNVLNWVHDHDGVYGSSIKEDLIKEAEYRRLFAFTSNEQYAGLVDNRWKVIDPGTGESTILPPPADYIEAVKDDPNYQRMREWVQEKRKKAGITNS